MKASIVVLIMAGICQPVFADECQFDQEARVERNIQLKEKYPGSYLIENNLVLVVPVAEGRVEITIGGCEHYGVSVELKTKIGTKYQSESELMALIVRLARSYSQGIVDTNILERVIKEKQWMQPGPPRAYLLNYEDEATFEVYVWRDDETYVFGFNYYS
ncbi:MAG: hypothetical protein OEZ10_06670 [Gammaproteobacteria bacterium]|nr:hypothetical protein [Gammaproteobacteria bacterium]